MREAVEKTLEALFKLEELRQIWRDTAPGHELSAEQSAEAVRLAREVKNHVDFIIAKLNERLER